MSLSVEQLTQPLKVAKKIKESIDAYSFALEIPDSAKKDFSYQAGQFVTLFLDIGGEAVNRSYSLCTSPLADSDFKITVKKVIGGKGSTYLCDQVKEGQILRVTKPAGHFFKPSFDSVHYFLIAAGSGVTPIYSILKTVLMANPENQVDLLYCNRNEEAIIYRQELETWQAKFKDRLRIHHLLSQPSNQWTGGRGRCTTEWLKKILKTGNAKLGREIYLCGPDGFMQNVREGLMAIGVDKSEIREESFALGIQPKSTPTLKADWTYIGDKTQAKEESGGKIIATVSGEVFECEAQKDQSILEALIEAGANPPYSCMDGACMACMAKVQEGLVYQLDPGILSDENIENRETLTCQARVLSRTVKVSYDDI